MAKGVKALKKAETELVEIKATVEALNAELAELSKTFEASTAEQKRLKDEAELMQRRLEAAEKLIAGLASERVRWTEDLKQLAIVREKLLEIACSPRRSCPTPVRSRSTSERR